MAHLRDRFCLIPFRDLRECPEALHHAVGSPYFDAAGQPLFPDPVVVAVRADIVEPALPYSSALAVSCDTRPYNSYGPVMRKIFEKSKPLQYPEVRKGLEGVMEVGHIRILPPGGLSEQVGKIFLGCVSTMTSGTNDGIVRTVLQNLALEFARLPFGSTLRMTLLGTGKARRDEATEDVLRSAVDQTLSQFYATLLPDEERVSPRRLLLVHPFEYESQLIANVLIEKSIFATILDKLQLPTTPKRLIYGLAQGEQPENRFMEESNFGNALDLFDAALDRLLEGKKRQALKEAAKGAEMEPMLNGMYSYITTLAGKKTGVLEAVTKEAMILAAAGRVRDALCVAQTLPALGGQKKEQQFLGALQESYLRYGVAAVEARLLYEHYMEATEALDALRTGAEIPMHGANKSASNLTVIKLPHLEPLQEIERKIPASIINNTFHVVIRKLMADQIETQGARRIVENLLQLKDVQKASISDSQEKVCQELLGLMEYINKEKENIEPKILRKTIVEKLLELLPQHTTLRLEAARFFLSGGHRAQESHAKSLTKNDIEEAWRHLQAGHNENLRDYGILSYLGFIILLQGDKYLSLAEDFYNLLAKLMADELGRGKFSLGNLKTPADEKIAIPITDLHTRITHEYYQNCQNNAQCFSKLARSLSNSEITSSLALYHEAIQGLGSIGRYDLTKLYEEILGETWVALECRMQKSLGSIPVLVGEIPLDLVVNVYKKIRRWWKYHNLTSAKIPKEIEAVLAKLRKQIVVGEK